MGRKGQRRRRMAPDSARARVWKAMRIMRTFTRSDLMAVAEATRDNLDRYIPALERAEYLIRARDKLNGVPAGHIIYRLVRDTGPSHPIPWVDGRVFDQNERKIFGTAAKCGQCEARQPERGCPDCPDWAAEA
jgi:hypothetical protein